MLTFFPTPYPGEWWYSVLSRWFVRSGYIDQAAGLRELYGYVEMKHGLLFPGPSCIAISKKIPAAAFDVVQIVLQHTLLPYYTRFMERSAKETILDAYASGSGSRMTNMDYNTLEGGYGPRYCPLCYREDREAYGEPYWHTEHQVPLMPLCPKHHCRLKTTDVTWKIQLKRFYPLSEVPCGGPGTKIKDWEITLSQVLSDYVRLPYFDGPSRDYNNLVWRLISDGYGAPRFLKKGALDAQKLQSACLQFFGPKIMDKYFNQADHNIFYRTVNWVFKTPERFGLLETFAGLSTSELFGPDLAEQSGIGDRLIEIQHDGARHGQEELLRTLNINSCQLEMIAEKYGVPLFWKQKYGKGEKERTKQLNLCVTFEEKELVREMAALQGSKQPSVFARMVLIKHLQEIKAKTTGGHV